MTPRWQKLHGKKESLTNYELDFGKRKTITIDLVLKALDRDCIEWRHSCEAWLSKDPWLSQLDWTPRAYSGKYKRMPKWAANFLVGDQKLSVKTPIAGLLLKLKWEDSPVEYTRTTGYRYRNAGWQTVQGTSS